MFSQSGLPTPPLSITANTPSAEASLTPGNCWWNANLPEKQWTKDCPDFLQGQAEKDVQIMSIKDQNHPRLIWDEVKGLIDSGCIGQFHRMPSDLRRYIKYCYELKKRYGSVLYFIQHERLNWPSINPSGDAPFSNDADYKILYNDWPYSLEQDVTHVVVWTKFVLEENPRTGLITDGTREILEDFVVKTFCQSLSHQQSMERSNLRWFKNWTSLRSVHALEHFHVMLYKAPQELLDRVTNKDKPMCDQFEGQ